MKSAAVILAVALLAIVVWQHRTVRQLRADNGALTLAQAEVERLQTELAQAKSQPDLSDEIAKLQAENRDLPKVRNEVRQLREQKQEFERVRADNERLRTATSASNPSRATARSPFIARDKLSNVGLATPEAAVQTCFWAICTANLQMLQQTLGSVEPETGGASLPNGDLLRRATEMGNKMTGYEIIAQKTLSADKMQLALRIHTDDLMEVQQILKRVGNEWKLDMRPDAAVP